MTNHVMMPRGRRPDSPKPLPWTPERCAELRVLWRDPRISREEIRQRLECTPGALATRVAKLRLGRRPSATWHSSDKTLAREAFIKWHDAQCLCGVVVFPSLAEQHLARSRGRAIECSNCRALRIERATARSSPQRPAELENVSREEILAKLSEDVSITRLPLFAPLLMGTLA